MQDLNLRLSWQKQRSKEKKTRFTSKIELNLRKKVANFTSGAQFCVVLKTGHFGKEIKNT